MSILFFFFFFCSIFFFFHVSMKVIHAKIRNGIIYPKEKLDIDGRDVLIRIGDLHEIKLEAREDIIDAIAELDIEEMK